jgi:hypothetical protein
MPYHPQENKAQKLWAGYDKRNEESFWKKYTPLLKEAATIRNTHEVAQPTTLPLYSNKKNYAGQPRIILISVLFIMAMYGMGLHNIASVALVFWIVLLIVITSEMLSHTSFEISPTALCIHKTFEKNIAVIQWATIQHIYIKRTIHEGANETYTSKNLEINFYEQGKYQVLIYNYNLPEKEQRVFLHHLRQYVKHVHTS